MTGDAPTFHHQPVLAASVVEQLAVRAGGRYLDGTLGGGGHAEAILAASAPDGTLVGIDRDPDAIAAATARLAPFGGRFGAVRGAFGDLDVLVAHRGPFDGVLLDIGVSSHQLDQAGRGFSFRQDGPVDMRMDPDLPLDAAGLLDRLDEAALTDILFRYGEEPRARRIARAVLAGRPWTSTVALADCVAKASGWRGGRTHPATRTFQALRIAVNDELGQLARGLEAALALLRPGGRVAVITFHSLEDRLVKHRLREAAGIGTPRDAYGRPLAPPMGRLVLRHAIDGATSDPSNPRARSARLRVFERAPDPSLAPPSPAAPAHAAADPTDGPSGPDGHQQ